MDMRKIKKLIELIQRTGVAEIEIREGEESVRITREIHKMAPIMMAQPAMNQAPQQEAPKDHKLESQATHIQGKPESPIAHDKHTIKSPMVGTVYLSPNPGSKPFVDKGTPVEFNQPLFIIE